MKKIIVLASLGIILIMSSCILPSLHPIVNDDNRITDDRVLGAWSLNGDVSITEFNITIETDNPEENVDSLKTAAEAKMAEALGVSDQSTWKFERASKVVWEKKDADNPEHGTTISMDFSTASKQPRGFTLKSKEDHPFYILTYKEGNKKTGKKELKVEMTKIGGELYFDFVPINLRPDESRFSYNNISGHTFAKIKFEGDKLVMYPFDGEYIEDLIKKRRIRLKHEVVGDRTILTASTQELRAFIEKYGTDEQLFGDKEELVALK